MTDNFIKWKVQKKCLHNFKVYILDILIFYYYNIIIFIQILFNILYT